MREFGGIRNDEGFDYFQWSLPREDLIELIPEGARRILDVGCGVRLTRVRLIRQSPSIGR
jgi:hypothetical protein